MQQKQSKFVLELLRIDAVKYVVIGAMIMVLIVFMRRQLSKTKLPPISIDRDRVQQASTGLATAIIDKSKTGSARNKKRTI